jgi:hypothetical protein
VCSKEDSDPDADTAYDVQLAGSAEFFARCVGLSTDRDIRIMQKLVVATLADATTASLILSSNGVDPVSGAGTNQWVLFGVAGDFGQSIPGTSPVRYYDRAQAYLTTGFQTQDNFFDLNAASNGVTIEAEWRRVGNSWTLHSSKLNGVVSSLSGSVGFSLAASAGYVWHGMSGTNGGKTYTSYYMKVEFL